MHKADNSMVTSLHVSGEYVVIGYEDGTVRCLQLKKQGRRRPRDIELMVFLHWSSSSS